MFRGLCNAPLSAVLLFSSVLLLQSAVLQAHPVALSEDDAHRTRAAPRNLQSEREAAGMGAGEAGGMQRRVGPLAAACEGLEEEAQCTIMLGRGAGAGAGAGADEDDDNSGDNKAVGICRKMLNNELHCHILHPSALACLGLDEGASCTFQHRGSQLEEKGACKQMPHGTVCRPSMNVDDGAEGPPGRETVPDFVQVCAEKKAGDRCSLQMPHDVESQYSGVCEEPGTRLAQRENGKDDEGEGSRKSKRKLRCRMLNPLEAACLGMEAGNACNVTLRAHGTKVEEQGECKAAVRGKLHCRHVPRSRKPNNLRMRGRTAGSPKSAKTQVSMKMRVDAMNKALFGVGEGQADPDDAELRKFPAPKSDSPSPKEDDKDNAVDAPAPQKSSSPAPEFQDNRQ